MLVGASAERFEVAVEHDLGPTQPQSRDAVKYFHVTIQIEQAKDYLRTADIDMMEIGTPSKRTPDRHHFQTAAEDLDHRRVGSAR